MTEDFTNNSMKTIILAEPRGFCAGVDRAVRIVEESLNKFGAPVYVRHGIVHNKHVSIVWRQWELYLSKN